MAVPSILSPVVVTFTPPSDASRTVLRLLTVLGPLPVLLSTLRFQVPSELSAPKTPIAVIATPITNFAKMLCIVFFPSLPLLNFWEVAVGGQRCFARRWWGIKLADRSRQHSLSIQPRVRLYHDWESFYRGAANLGKIA